MSLFDNDSPSSAPKGGLAALSKFKKFAEEHSGGNDSNTWGDIWDARGGYAFSMKNGTEAEVIALGDIKVFVATPIFYGWASGGFNYPRTEHLPSVAFDSDCESNGEVSIITEVTGLTPKPIGVLPVIDCRPYEKDGKTQKYTFKVMIIKDMALLTQLGVVSSHHDRPLTFGHFHLTRSMNKTSPSVGDTWFCKGFVEEDKLASVIPDWKELLARFNFDKGFPTPDKNMSMELLRQHIAVCDKNVDSGNKSVHYDKDLWAQLTGKPVESAAEEGTAPKEDAFQSLLGDKTATVEKQTSDIASELDSLLG